MMGQAWARFSAARANLRLRTVGIVAAIVVGVLLLVAGAWFWSSAQQHRGSAAYASTLLRVQQSRLPDSPPEARLVAANELESVLASYPSNTSAAEAAYELGNLRFQGGEYAKARSAWEVSVARSSSPTVTTLARAGIGYSWEAERKFPEAIQAFEGAMSGLQPTSFYYEELLLDLSRVQERAGKKDGAVSTYQRILKDLPKSPRTDEIRARLVILGAKP